MNKNGGYPLGSEYDPFAPWNEKDDDVVAVDVDVTITTSKTYKIELPKNYKEEDVFYFIEGLVRNLKLTDQSNQTYSVDDFEIEDCYER